MRCSWWGRAAAPACCRNPARRLASALKPRLDVPESRRFTGFDAYRALIASDVDVVLHCTPPHFRPAHFAAATAAGSIRPG